MAPVIMTLQPPASLVWPAEPRVIVSPSGKAVIYTQYDPERIPPRRSSPPALLAGKSGTWTRFICISDTHNREFFVPDGDILLHSGDLTSIGRTHQMQKAMSWIANMSHPVKMVIAGNHDLVLDQTWYRSNYSDFHGKRIENIEAAVEAVRGLSATSRGIYYLEYESGVAKGGEKEWNVYGSPASPWFGGWAFNIERGEEAVDLHAKIPASTEVLLSHSPPLSVLDTVMNGEHVGDEALFQRIAEIQPRLHVFGHIHEARGAHVHVWPKGDASEGNQAVAIDGEEISENETVFINAACEPMGQGRSDAKAQGHPGSFGGLNFQPIIVDLWTTNP